MTREFLDIPHPPPMNPLDRTKTFSTERLQLAIYLHADQRFLFLSCDAGQNGKIRFVFDNADNLGPPEVELDFDRGAEVAASDLFASQKYLRRKMSEEIDEINGNSKYGKSSNHPQSTINLQPPARN